MDAIYTAFDEIDHNTVLAKLSNIGFSRPLVERVKSYLLDRGQYVQFQHVRSYTFKPTSDVPQGCNLGPVLFILSINDITDVLDSNILCVEILFEHYYFIIIIHFTFIYRYSP